jgi:hypothetical protein
MVRYEKTTEENCKGLKYRKKIVRDEKIPEENSKG